MTADIPRVILHIETSREHGRQLLRGIAEYARLHGPWAFYSEPGGRQTSYPKLDNWHADGIITRGWSQELDSMHVPLICASDREYVSSGVTVSGDYAATGRTAAEYLLNRGFRHYAFCGLNNTYWSKQREMSFRKIIERQGLPCACYDRPVAAIQRFWDREQTALAQWLESLPKPVALMACNDERGKHVIEACRIAGLRVPDEVAVIGVDNDALVCDLCNPPLSSIALDHKRAGYEAAEILAKMMAGAKIERHRIVNQVLYVVSRQSTDILATEDPDVATALRFIHEHAKKPIQVSDVADTVGVSRRWLHEKFTATLGRSVHKEIARVRTEQITRMLIDTQFSIAQIALGLGFPNVDHIARFFRRQTGMTPLAYRKQHSRKE